MKHGIRTISVALAIALGGCVSDPECSRWRTSDAVGIWEGIGADRIETESLTFCRLVLHADGTGWLEENVSLPSRQNVLQYKVSWNLSAYGRPEGTLAPLEDQDLPEYYRSAQFFLARASWRGDLADVTLYHGRLPSGALLMRQTKDSHVSRDNLPPVDVAHLQYFEEERKEMLRKELQRRRRKDSTFLCVP